MSSRSTRLRAARRTSGAGTVFQSKTVSYSRDAVSPTVQWPEELQLDRGQPFLVDARLPQPDAAERPDLGLSLPAVEAVGVRGEPGPQTTEHLHRPMPNG